MFNKLLVATIMLATSNQVMADQPASMSLTGTATVTAAPSPKTMTLKLRWKLILL
jgi:hypothetical protein